MALREDVEALIEKVKELGIPFDLEGKKRRIEELKGEISDPSFWQKPEAKEKVALLSRLEEEVERIEGVKRECEELLELVSLAEEDPSLEGELVGEVEGLKRKVEELELSTLFTDPLDERNAILTLKAGAGGTEACDWVEILLRMYTMWADKKGYKWEMLDRTPGEVVGSRTVTISVVGPYAYGYLKAERGVHRLVRISPFDANRRRHTTFALVDVIPEMPESEIVINEEDLEIETFRASAPGGQHMQKNETAVRIRHIPTGIVVSCQSERSQYQNKLSALKILRARLAELERKKREEAIKEIRGEKQEIAWGSQIRSYVLYPYTLIKDHRTGVERRDVQEVLDGDLDDFIYAFLKQSRNS
ncbi:peptide chain release factor 2 [bacterium]|nr:peptide chain release factor 2 [bacterium]